MAGAWHGERSIIATGDVTGPGIGGVLEALTGGATLIRASRERLETLNLINLFQPCQLTSTPGVLGELIDRMDEHGIACPSVTTIRLVGSLVDEQVLRRIDSHFDARIYVAYGAAEVGIVSGGALDPAAFRRGYVGRLVPAVKLVTSGTQADPAPIVLVRDPETFNCYYVGGKVIPNTETFHMMPDLGYVEGDRLYLAGRDDEVLNISGNKIAFSVIDAELRREPMVKDVAVVSAASLGDPSGVVIGVVTEGEADLPLLRDRVLRVVDAPSAAEHVRLFALHVLPRNPFGKIDRARVIDLYGRST